MSEPNQAVAHRLIKRMQIMYLGIPFYGFLFLSLWIGRKPPFQDASHPRLPMVLPIEKFSLGRRIPPPLRVYGPKKLILPESYPLPHEMFVGLTLKQFL